MGLDGFDGYSKAGASRAQFERDALSCMNALGVNVEAARPEEQIAEALAQHNSEVDTCLKDKG
jgi:hypothetical protein